MDIHALGEFAAIELDGNVYPCRVTLAYDVDRTYRVKITAGDKRGDAVRAYGNGFSRVSYRVYFLMVMALLHGETITYNTGGKGNET